MLDIFRDLFINVIILIASISLGNMLARDKITTVNFKNGLILGALCGVQGCLLMVYGVRISPNLIVDFRSIPIIIMGMNSTFSSVMLTSVIIGLFRVLFFGWSPASFVSFFSALLMGISAGLIGKLNLKQYVKWILSSISICIISSVGFLIVVDDKVLLRDILSAYLTGMAIISTSAYYLKEYIHKSNDKYYILKESSSIDFLTGLQNVRHFDKALNSIMSHAKENKKSVSLLFIDIDFFKRVNDNFGHLNGDIVLRELAEMLQRQSRSFDVVTRNGGEEFTVLLTNCGLAEAMNVAERIRTTVETHEFITREKNAIRITVSIGVSCFPETTSIEEKLIEQADIALYTAKRSGRNRVCVSPLGGQNEP